MEVSMYGAMREHAPRSPQFTGLVSAVALTLAAGYALANGFGIDVSRVFPDPITYVALADAPVEPPLAAAETLDTSTDTTLVVPPLPLDIPQFEAEPRLIGDTDLPPLPPRTGPAEPGANVPPPRKSVRIAPKILPAAPPPYPAAQIRLKQEGNSGLSVCIDANGRVSSASLASSSGSDKLDEAALKWVRSARFKPATVDGAPQPICGHSVVYEWRLQDAR
jgi:protein TonB